MISKVKVGVRLMPGMAVPAHGVCQQPVNSSVRPPGSRPPRDPRDGAGRGPQRYARGRGLELQPCGVSRGAPAHTLRQRPGTGQSAASPAGRSPVRTLLGRETLSLPSQAVRKGWPRPRPAHLQGTLGLPSVCPAEPALSILHAVQDCALSPRSGAGTVPRTATLFRLSLRFQDDGSVSPHFAGTTARVDEGR